MHEFHFHEDDVGQIQVMPMANWNYCEREFAALIEHDKNHAAPNGAGWTKMYKFSNDAESLKDTMSLRDLKITEARFIELLSPHCKLFERLVSPLSEYDEELGIRSIGFGPAKYAGIIADMDGELVASIWCMLPGRRQEDNVKFADMLTALSRDHHLLLVDWAQLRLVDLRLRRALESYLRD